MEEQSYKSLIWDMINSISPSFPEEVEIFSSLLRSVEDSSEYEIKAHYMNYQSTSDILIILALNCPDITLKYNELFLKELILVHSEALIN